MFAKDKFAKVWKVFPKDKADQRFTDVQLSTSKKTKQGYETDFNDVVRLIATANDKVAELEANDRIKILDCGVSNYYNKEKGRKYYTFCVFDFSFVSDKKQEKSDNADNEEWVDMSNISDDQLPFAD